MWIFLALHLREDKKFIRNFILYTKLLRLIWSGVSMKHEGMLVVISSLNLKY